MIDSAYWPQQFTRTPQATRQEIPQFVPQASSTYYERYDEIVVPHTRATYADFLKPEEQGYQALYTYIEQALFQVLDAEEPLRMLDLGCGAGRLLWELARHFPQAQCLGVDTSYNMLRQAQRLLFQEAPLELHQTHRGWPVQHIQLNASPQITTQIQLIQADWLDLPLPAACADLICSSFSLDRLHAPLEGLDIVHHLLEEGGYFLLATPFNFQEIAHWEALGDMERLLEQLMQRGFDPILIDDEVEVCQPLDAHGNAVHWCSTVILAQKIG